MKYEEEQNKNHAKKAVVIQWISHRPGVSIPLPDKSNHFVPIIAIECIPVDTENGRYLLYNTLLTPIVPEGYVMELQISPEWVNYDVVTYTTYIFPGSEVPIIIRVRPMENGEAPDPEKKLVKIGNLVLRKIEYLNCGEFKPSVWDKIISNLKTTFNFNDNDN